MCKLSENDLRHDCYIWLFDCQSAIEAEHMAENRPTDGCEQAAASARRYLSLMPFSRQSLIAQLEYDGFSHAQAVYAAEQNGY